VFEATLLRGEQDAPTLDRRHRCLERGREQLAALTEILIHADPAVVQHALDATSALPVPVSCADSDVARIPAMPTAPEVRARVLEVERAVAQARAYGRLGQERQVEDIVARVLPQIRAIPYPRAEAELLLLDAESKRQLSDTRGAVEAFQGSFRAALRADDDVVAVRAATLLVYMFCVWLHKVEEGEHWIALAEAIADRTGHNDAIDADLISGRTVINDTSGHPERNVELREKHVSILKRLYGDRDPRVAGAIADLGVTVALLGQYESAVKYFQEGIDRVADSGGSHNPRLALHYENLACALAALARFDEAKGAYENGLALLVDHPPGPLNVILLSELAGVENELGHADAALERAEKALEVARAIGEKGKFEWQARFVHAEARGKKWDWRGQAAECAEIVGLQRTAGQVAPNLPYWPDALTCLAEAELGLRKVDAALAHLEESVKLESRPDVEGLPKARFALAKALRMAGRDPARVRQLAEGARDDLRKLAGKGRDVAKIEVWLEHEFQTFTSKR
jgi:tetratricopeptide (TPR) repeat protein